MAKAPAKINPPRARLVLKVSLRGIRPAIWRRLEVPAAIKLHRLHEVLQVAFGWTNSHLHAFRVGEQSYQPPYPEDWGDDFFGSPKPKDERRVRLGDLLRAAPDRLVYEYDFGDGWEHEVRLEKVLPAAASKGVFCLAGARSGPPEDCGGIGGFENLVRAMADVNHPERAGLLEWLGEPFDPEAFSVEGLNQEFEWLKI